MAPSKSGKTGSIIWSLIDVDQLVDAIVFLDDRIDQLKDETWRLNTKTRPPDSLWYQVINQLPLDQSECTRKKLYKIWRFNRFNIRERVEGKRRVSVINENNRNDCDINESLNCTVKKRNNLILCENLSLPLPGRPNTRANEKENINGCNSRSLPVSETSLVLNPSEWKAAFSKTQRKMNEDWTDIFSGKLALCGVECSLSFTKAHIKKGKRKRVCNFFWFRAICTIGKCKRSYCIILKNEPDVYTSALFFVQTIGEINHGVENGTSTRQLRGKKRYDIGKRANEIGSLAVFRENLEMADEKLLIAGNLTDCQTIEVIKKAAADYRKKMLIDEDMFKECRMLSHFYNSADVTSIHIGGYIQAVGEIPFRAHLYSEDQIERYAKYCIKEKYSFLHLDSTGGILKQMNKQQQSLLYAVIFKDGNDCGDTASLGHALLTRHTVPSISFFLADLAYSIVEVKNKLILPSFFIIDFSAALMNSILTAFNQQNINTHLNQCWNVISGNYDSEQLRSLSFIHLCCCHVIHAVARSLNAAHIDKKIRKGILYMFAFILCSNDIKELYNILGLVINIFGDPNEEKAKEKFERFLSFQLNVDEESVSILTDSKKIFKEAKEKNDELKIVDEYFRSTAPIIHQSPFNKEAIRLYPDLKILINNKSKCSKSINPLFSPSIIRLFYRWWAYLPLWTGLLCNYKERYASDIKSNLNIIYEPVRHSNAVIESYFRTLKGSIFQGKAKNRPSEVIMELHRSVQVQAKANKFDVKQSSKNRKKKRKKKDVVRGKEEEEEGREEEIWCKKGVNGRRRNEYVKEMAKLVSKRARLKMNDGQPFEIVKQMSASDISIAASSSNKSVLSSNNFNCDIPSNEPSLPSKSDSSSSSIKSNLNVSIESSIDASASLGEFVVNNDEKSKSSVEIDFDTNIIPSIKSPLYCVDNELIVTTNQLSKKPPNSSSSHAEVLIDGYTLRWPKFQIENFMFQDKKYTLFNTCPTDSALFALYFLYKTDLNISEEFKDAPETSPYSTLVKTFEIVEKEGWDAARISWLLTFDLLKTSDRKKNLFGSVNEQVFCFVKYLQRYSIEIECTRPQCKRKTRIETTTELNIFPSDQCIEKFDGETFGLCDVIMAYPGEINEEEARKYNYSDRVIQLIEEQTNIIEDVHGWICYSKTIISEASFECGYPPIVIVNVKPPPRRNVEGYEYYVVRLRDMKQIIRIGYVQYKLCSVIHHKSSHFTATLISTDGTFYVYDDMKGVKEVRMSSDPVVVGIYSRIFEF
ncbi:unnamed protein product [Adineta steineri]|uniref:Uncharacterized protein n=1 Tax=Adineta steineri TaxID=433720 RepID=A0A815SDB1_9BILA|nr:unnamed protein product [Adineta steineri]CAF4060396.1 unnamed protein product [Adineta steineri]